MTAAEERAHTVPLGEFGTCPHHCVERMGCGDCRRAAPDVDALISDRRRKALRLIRNFKKTGNVSAHLLNQVEGPIAEDPDFGRLAHHAETCVHHEIALRMERIKRAARTLKASRARVAKKQAWDAIVPPNYRHTDLDLIPNRAITDSVLGFSQSGSAPGVLAFGPVGTGKTRTCLLLLRKWMSESHRPNWSFKFIEAAAINDNAVALSRSGGMGDWINELLKTDALMIDDIGHNGFSPSYLDALRRILERATSHGIPVLVTCQYDSTALFKQWTGADPGKAECVKAIMRRLGEFCRPVQFSKGLPRGDVKPGQNPTASLPAASRPTTKAA